MRQHVILYVLMDPVAVSQRLSPLKPDRVTPVGARTPSGKAKRPCWTYVGKEDEAQRSASAHFRRLFADLAPVWASLISISHEAEIALAWVVEVYADEETPGAYLEPDILEKLVELRSSLDVDMYFISDQVGPDEPASGVAQTSSDSLDNVRRSVAPHRRRSRWRR